MASSNSAVYTGAWTNWADGQVKGATITLTTLHGSYLVAFLAVYVRIVGSHFWNILAWLIFHSRTTRQSRDGLHHQQQALLANSLTDSGAIWRFARLGWFWRKRSRNVFWRTLSFISIALVHFIAFTAAGIFSAAVTSTRSEVLLRDTLCGTFTAPEGDPTSLAVRQSSTRLSAINVKALRSGYQYGTSCYDQTKLDNTLLQSCNAYGRKDVKWTVNMVPDCPFDPKLCLTDSALFDTGPIDSALDLGINSELKDRITVRNVMQCSPITTHGYVFGPLNNVSGLVANYPEPGALNTWTQYAYGENYATGSNATFSFTNESIVTSQGGGYDYRPYILDVEWATAGALEGSFIPIPELNRTDADVLLFFLTKAQTAYYTPVNDPFFQANLKLESTSIEETSSMQITSDFYAAKDPVGVMACTSQWQYCNPATSTCSVLSGQQLAVNDLKARKLFTARQLAVGNRIDRAGKAGYLMILASEYLGSSFMVASSLLGATLGEGLPDNQWVLELNHWMRVGFTTMQIGLNWWVTGDGIATHDQYKVAPRADEQWMCSNQLVQRDDYSSFSVLGIALILLIGGMIILAEMLLNPIANFHRRRMYHGTQTSMPPFNAANVLQLQRLAFEGQGLCNQWEMSSPYDVIPVTRKGRDLKFEDLSRQAAPASSDSSIVSHKTWTGTGYDKIQQTPSSAGQMSQETMKDQLTSSHTERALSYSRPFLYQRSLSESQDASMMEIEQGYHIG